MQRFFEKHILASASMSELPRSIWAGTAITTSTWRLDPYTNLNARRRPFCGSATTATPVTGWLLPGVITILPAGAPAARYINPS
ncbi:hypothetical protein M8494_36225 [Serratia ureilytica]